MTLIARWYPTDYPLVQRPDFLTWADGSAATLEDYRSKAGETYRDTFDDAGSMIRHIYSDIVADVYYDQHVGSWAIRGDGVLDKGSLEIADPDATDLRLTEAAALLTMSYRIRVTRFQSAGRLASQGPNQNQGVKRC